ncbi:P-loop NTPase fold protein [Patulibacter sp. SYSU D01012]|uniref:P-loop NTPase fold protein n=1 Tax=Patulibacter sp. SYSU D01012 TaxID=2817381 RepID=UPI001B313C40|nr:P-loop NTPase fold protein [Patulibacter sp. SYSU D01012]
MSARDETYTIGDAPIGAVEDDRLDRDRLAEALARQVLSARREDGFVLGIDGAWGSGKTSLLALLKEHLGADDLAIDFNPWLYADKDELVMRFLAQVRAQLPDDGKDDEGGRYRAAKKALGRFQGAMAPLTGLAALHPAFLVAGVAAAIADKAKAGAQTGKEGVVPATPDLSAEEARDAVKEALLGLPGRLVVFIDDVDRLAAQEVAEMMRVIKLVGDFPNVSYVVAFDRGHVERALTEVHGGSGSAFLEKVIQATHEVPYLPSDRLAALLREDLAAALGGAEHASPLTSPRWPLVEANIIAPLLTTVRDVRRLSNVLPVSLALTGADVDAVDVTALEAVRLAEPNLHKLLVEAAPTLTRATTETYKSLASQASQDHDRDVVGRFVLGASAPNRKVARRVVLHLFPGAASYLEGEPVVTLAPDEWLAERRVASLSALLTYLSKAVGQDSVGAALTDEATQLLSRPDEFDALTARLSESQLWELMRRIRFKRDELDSKRMPFVLAALSNVQLRVPYDGRGSTDPFLGGLVLPIVHDLLARATDIYDDEQASMAYAAATSLSAKYRFIQLCTARSADLGDRPLLSERAVAAIRAQHQQELLAASATTLAQEQAFYELVELLVLDHDAGRPRLAVLMESGDFLRRILKGYVGTERWKDDLGWHKRLGDDNLETLADIVGKDAFERVVRGAHTRHEHRDWGPLDTERLQRALALAANGATDPNTGPETSTPPSQPDDEDE